MPKILRRLKINEVSSVDRGAGEGVKIVMMKRDDSRLAEILDDATKIAAKIALNPAYRGITTDAQQFPDATGGVIVINVERLGAGAPAQEAFAPLFRKHGFITINSDSILPQESTIASDADFLGITTPALGILLRSRGYASPAFSAASAAVLADKELNKRFDDAANPAAPVALVIDAGASVKTLELKHVPMIAQSLVVQKAQTNPLDAHRVIAAFDDAFHNGILLEKREFSSEQRRRMASSGAAMSDGSFPIANKSDLHNAMQAIGRAKNPAKAKAHIRRRARALGLSGELTDAFKMNTVDKVQSFFSELFTREPEPDVEEQFSTALAGLAESVKSIKDDPSVNIDRDDMLAKSFAQFHDHVSPLLGQALERQSAVEGDSIMTAQLKKALGLNDDASEEDALKAIAALAEKARRKENGDDEDEDEEEEDEEEKKKRRAKGKKEDDEEEEEKMLKLRRTLPAALQKQIAEGQEAMKRVKKLEDEAALATFTKRAVDSGLPASEGATLQKLFAAAPDEAEKLLKLTVAGFAAAKEAGAYKEFGSTGLNGSGTAFDQITALAQKYMVDHPDEKLTAEQAFAKVYASPANKQLRIQEARESGRSA